jgi:hypothetical protein
LLIDSQHLVLVEDARHVTLVNMATRQTAWTYQPRAPTSLTGEPPQLFGKGSVFCLLMPLNFGYQLERIDPATGNHLWGEARRISKTAFAGTTAAFDATTLYYAVDGILHARALADGKRLWAQPLPAPAGPWQVVRTSPDVAVTPVPSLAAVWNRASRVPCLVPAGFAQLPMPLPRASMSADNGPGCQVLFHDPRDGQLLERLSFATIHPWAGLQVLPRRLVVAAEGKAWGLASGGE